MREFARALMTSSLAPDELLLEIRIPVWPQASGAGFVEFARRHGDFAVVSAAALVALDSAGRIRRASLTLGGATPTPQRLAAAEAALLGRPPDAGALDLVAAAGGSIDAMGDAAYPAWYRRRLAAALLRRSLAQAFGGAGNA
jgi:aerobic carbon-monoxide dehydrogenase medium subunit